MKALETYLHQLRDELLAQPVGGFVDALAWISGAEENHLDLALCTTDGELISTRTDRAPLHSFPMQSISKAFAYGAAIDRHGKEHVVFEVDEEPTGEEFNAISIDRRTGRPKNPLVNVGAIRIHAMLGTTREQRTATLEQVLHRATGRRLQRHEDTAREEILTADRNIALAYMLRAAGSMADDAVEVVTGYVDGCAMLVTVEDLAVMAATLANGGVNPQTGERALSPLAARQVLSIMMTCGMYDNAGDWMSDVGLPAKSGVSGGIIASLPTHFGIATYAPQLDEHGNSVRGVMAFERMSDDFSLHMMTGEEPRVAEDLIDRAPLPPGTAASTT